jgi:riboflavin kinase/FMN adenylyltransferase
MEIISGQFRVHDKYQGISLALGTFDGVHLGHRKIIERVVKSAELQGGTSMVFTFDPHPRAVLRPQLALRLLMDYQEKRDILTALDIDVLLMFPFHLSFSKLTPEEFVRDILVTFICPELVVVGPNYTFGYEGRGTPELLKTLGLKYGFRVEVVEPVYVGTQMVSSTIIRKLINSGEVAEAEKLLGRPFSIQGKVIAGDRRGRTLGFPTANIEFPVSSVIPADGVYAVWVVIDQAIYPGVANVGTNPTFLTQHRRMEVHLLDFEADLYGKDIRVRFMEHLRGEMIFNNAAELIIQIKKDINNAQIMLQL